MMKGNGGCIHHTRTRPRRPALRMVYNQAMRRTDQHTFFFTDRDAFSNWHIAPFSFRGIEFNCVEQFMMYAKAKTFGDDDIAARILRAKHPKEQKALGRAVQSYDDAVWAAKRMKVVYVACREKFTQHPHLLAQLLATAGTVLVEASPYDRVWGIGMGENAPGVDDPANWRGQNLLGKVLTRLREDLSASLEPPVRRFPSP